MAPADRVAAPLLEHAASAPAADEPPTRRRLPQLHPFHVLYPVAAVAALVLSQGPVRDPDVYWHVRLGGELLHTHSLSAAGRAWSLVPPHEHWTSSEWLAEVVLHGFVSAFGWQGMLVYQSIVAVVLLAVLAFAIRPGIDPRTRALVYAVTAISVAPFFQARPQTLSLVLLVWLGCVCRNVLLNRQLPRPWLFLALIVLWAQLHGLWLMAPVFLAVAAVLQVLDDRDRATLHFALRAIALSVAGLAVGCINPMGIRSLTLPLTLHSATGSIAEWQATTIGPYFTWGLLLLAAAQIFTWTRRSERIPLSEMAWTAVLLLFAFMAYRNVAVALLLLAPVVAVTVSRPRPMPAPRPGEARLLAAAVLTFAAVGVLVAVVTAVAVDPFPRQAPTRLASVLNDGHAHRVLDAYNTGGVVVAFGGPHVRVGIDGRADYYGADYIKRYADMLAMRRGWQGLFDRLAPDAAIIEMKGPLAAWLLDHGWSERGRQGAYGLYVKQ